MKRQNALFILLAVCLLAISFAACGVLGNTPTEPPTEPPYTEPSVPEEPLPTEDPAAVLSYFTYAVENGNAVITDVNEEISGVVAIPSEIDGYKVTAIGYDAFRSCRALTGIVIPNTMTRIGENAFAECESLQDVYVYNMTVWCGISFSNHEANPLHRNGKLYMNGAPATNIRIWLSALSPSQPA